MDEPELDQIRRVIFAAVRRLSCSVEPVASALHVSASTLHRRLASHQTSFSAERRAAKLECAFELLTGGGLPSIPFVASSVDLSTDYLRSAMRTAYGITPSQLVQTQRLLIDLELTGPPATRRAEETQRHLVLRIEELLKLVTPTTGPVAEWAAGVSAAAQPKETLTYRERQNRAKEQRRKSAQARDAEWVQSMTEAELMEAPAYPELLQTARASRPFSRQPWPGATHDER